MFSELYTIKKFEFRVVTFILNQTIYWLYVDYSWLGDTQISTTTGRKWVDR